MVLLALSISLQTGHTHHLQSQASTIPSAKLQPFLEFAASLLLSAQAAPADLPSNYPLVQLL